MKRLLIFFAVNVLLNSSYLIKNGDMTAISLKAEINQGRDLFDEGNLVEITNEEDHQKIVDIITSSMQSPLTDEAVEDHELKSFRYPHRFHSDSGVIYWFETQDRLLIIYDNGYESEPEYYHASDFEGASEIHSKYTE